MLSLYKASFKLYHLFHPTPGPICDVSLNSNLVYAADSNRPGHVLSSGSIRDFDTFVPTYPPYSCDPSTCCFSLRRFYCIHPSEYEALHPPQVVLNLNFQCNRPLADSKHLKRKPTTSPLPALDRASLNDISLSRLKSCSSQPSNTSPVISSYSTQERGWHGAGSYEPHTPVYTGKAQGCTCSKGYSVEYHELTKRPPKQDRLEAGTSSESYYGSQSSYQRSEEGSFTNQSMHLSQQQTRPDPRRRSQYCMVHDT